MFFSIFAVKDTNDFYGREARPFANGAYGSVHRATKGSLRYAVKYVAFDVTDKKAVTQLVGELRVLRMLRHANLLHSKGWNSPPNESGS